MALKATTHTQHYLCSDNTSFWSVVYVKASKQDSQPKRSRTPRPVRACRKLGSSVKWQHFVPQPYSTRNVHIRSSWEDTHTHNTDLKIWNGPIKSPKHARGNHAMHGLILTHNSLSWLALIKFAQTLCRGPSVHFWVKGLSVHCGLTQWARLEDYEHEADRHSTCLCIQMLPLSCLSHKYPTMFSISNSRPLFLFFLFHSSRQTTLIWRHDILKHSAGWYGISPRLLWNRSSQLKHQPGTHFSISLLRLLSSSPPTPLPLTFSGGKYLTACYWVPCAVWRRPGCGRDMYIDKTVLLRVAADILR